MVHKYDKDNNIRRARYPGGSRKTHNLNIKDVNMVLAALEKEANMSKKEKRALLNSQLTPEYVGTYKNFMERREAKMSMGSWRLLLAIALPLYTGFRRSDCIKLRWSNVMTFDHDGRLSVRDTMNLIETKTKNRREIPINDDLAYYISKAYAEIKPRDMNDWVFVPKFTRSTEHKPVSGTAYGMWIRDAFARFEVYDREGWVAPHSLRKTYCQWLFEQFGSNFEALMKLNRILGHSSIEMTMKYLDLRMEEFEDAHKRISFRGPELRAATRAARL